jgi:molecular chaperone DnaJ
MASLPNDLYAVLGVDTNASDDVIKKSYRKLARELHPDLNPGDAAAEERFKQVTLAYEILSDADRRRQYDRQVAGGGDPFAGFAMGGISDLFEAFFGGGGGAMRTQRRGGPSRGPDLETSVELSFSDAIFGATQEVVVRALVGCSTCEGSGAKPGTQSITCPTCAGSGVIRRIRQSILGQMVTEVAC